MAIFNSYVKLPEGICFSQDLELVRCDSFSLRGLRLCEFCSLPTREWGPSTWNDLKMMNWVLFFKDVLMINVLTYCSLHRPRFRMPKREVRRSAWWWRNRGLPSTWNKFSKNHPSKFLAFNFMIFNGDSVNNNIRLKPQVWVKKILLLCFCRLPFCVRT